MLAEATLTLRVKINLKTHPTSNQSHSILDKFIKELFCPSNSRLIRYPSIYIQRSTLKILLSPSHPKENAPNAEVCAPPEIRAREAYSKSLDREQFKA